MNTQLEQDELDKMRNNPDNYKWGTFYFNPKDYRVFVPKRIKILGWTLNFANPYSYLVIFGIIIIAVIVVSLQT